MCTTGTDHAARELLDQLSRLADNVRSGEAHEATHCICGSPGRRTLKLLFALARGAWVVSPQWLEQSVRAGRVLPPVLFECAAEIPGCVAARLHVAAEVGGVLSGLCVRVGDRVGGMSTAELELLLRTAGAQVETADPGSPPLSIFEANAAGDAKTMSANIPTDEEGLFAAIMAGGVGLGKPAPPASMLPLQPTRTASAVAKESERLVKKQRGCKQPASKPATSPRSGKRRGGQVSCAPVLGLTPPSGSQMPLSSSLRLLPPLETLRDGKTASQDYFLLDDALQLYRKRLPLCNVDLSKGKQRRDFLGALVENGWNGLLYRQDGVMAACTFVPHVNFCELQLLAVNKREAQKGLGTLLLGAVERWMQQHGHRLCVALAGMDCLAFWEKRGYNNDFSLNPESWGALQDPFGNSKVVAKKLVLTSH